MTGGVSSVDVWVRVGNLRASLTIDAGTVRYELPHEVLYTLSDLVSNRATAQMKSAVECCTSDTRRPPRRAVRDESQRVAPSTAIYTFHVFV